MNVKNAKTKLPQFREQLLETLNYTIIIAFW